ncbi:GTP pyrophosphokinase family protein [Tessaracoccus sp. HDW20]|uniref:GTP pyrophosphokinase n=1 Tax=Tessaracoccus coleopterorum TaxID=2714950 RepID=UPI0018D29669|nr:GTP pyrophosphokinase family protein [Tessaracoccus coleopterorum]NHB85379.1 GTP pyrophosphokinase family protein [Tessaracoccus coleopterorum]
MAEHDRRLAGLLDSYAEGPTAEPEEILRRLRDDYSRFRLEYSCGMDEVATKINILRKEFDETHRYKPIEHVKTRLKSMESLLEKASRLGCGSDLEAVRRQIRDVAGIRVVCAFRDDTYAVADMLVKQPDVTLLEKKDYIANPKPNGYQSLHLIVEVPVFLSDGAIQVPVEVQIRTIAMDFWASIEHQIHYKYEGQVPTYLRDNLKEVADVATSLDEQMGDLRAEVRSLER